MMTLHKCSVTQHDSHPVKGRRLSASRRDVTSIFMSWKKAVHVSRCMTHVYTAITLITEVTHFSSTAVKTCSFLFQIWGEKKNPLCALENGISITWNKTFILMIYMVLFMYCLPDATVRYQWNTASSRNETSSVSAHVDRQLQSHQLLCPNLQMDF